MNKEGYQTRDSAGLIAAGSILGPIIPPSVIMVIYASLAAGLGARPLHRRLRPGPPDRARPLPSSSGSPARRVRHALSAGAPRPALASGARLSTRAARLTLPVDHHRRRRRRGVFTTTEAGGIAVAYALFLGVVVCAP